jgi:hypothetical protein
MKAIIFVVLTIIQFQLYAQIHIDTRPKAAETSIVEQTTEKKEKTVSAPKEEAPSIEKTADEKPNIAQKSTPAPAFTGDLPPSAVPGKCFAKCVTPDKFKTVTEQVVDQPLTVKKVRIPATYKTVTDTIVETPKITKKVKTKEVYETVFEEVMVTPATTKWVKTKADAGCLSADPKDCEVLILVEMPPVYKKVEKKVLQKPSSIVDEIIPPVLKIVQRKVVDKEEQIIDEVIPATFKTVQNKVLVEKGGEIVWREVVCPDNVTKEKITKVQEALLRLGYKPGRADGIWGSQTRAAVLEYQRDKGLATGSLSIETLEALGIN